MTIIESCVTLGELHFSDQEKHAKLEAEGREFAKVSKKIKVKKVVLFDYGTERLYNITVLV